MHVLPRFVRLLTISALVVAAACSHPSAMTQDDATSRIDSGAALNTQTARYHLAHIQLTLEKVVALPDGMLGLRFSFGASSADCCSLFPRAALTDSTRASASTDVVIPAADIRPNGVLPMHMWVRDTNQKPSFRVDLASLGVPTS